MNTPDIDWESIGFNYVATDFNVRCTYKNGSWGKLRICDSPNINISIASSCLHYGQEAFEGIKAFRGHDGQIRIFRLEENARRLQASCDGLVMPQVPTELFTEAVIQAVKLNERFIPPYESGATLYIRPLIIGVGHLLGVRPAAEYEFIVFTSPISSYFKTGFSATKAGILRGYDRSAPLGTGCYKVGGNYASGMRAGVRIHELGYSSIIYLDPKEKKYIDECGAANFFGIRGDTYITPKSHSILPSITNNSLMQLCRDFGWTVEQRPVPVDELGTFDEAASCGTAAVVCPISQIHDIDTGHSYIIAKDGRPGPKCTKLYNHLRDIQYGRTDDTHGWNTLI